ncbi:hypothetical protein [Myroides odoratus]|uniref:hypothetical protein n=2 Tax=Myroides odoratus TaxID=256 RepID=UPI00024D6511|nr:hypothetical protein [Myroides odoratus]EHQ41998.1 hypothetical protein Myrod_1165 [Myroides odoratus DSM 2801]WQD58411.1 hypothetical protein U0010_04455 [Myroides odoratus]STZ29261.1 Uncharacterised protein [Myroides odoratus]
MRNILIVLMLSLSLLSCKGKVKKNNIAELSDIVNVSLLKKQFELQKNANLSDERYGPYNLTQLDLDLISDLMLHEYKKNGYVQPSESEFINRLKNIFPINFNCLSYGKINDRYIVYHGELMDRDRSTIEGPGMYISPAITKNLFFDLKNRIVLVSAPLDSFIFIYEDDSYSFNTNKEDEKYRKIDYHRNNYFLNRNKASLRWLMGYDEFFMRDLVKVVGYEKDQELLEWVIEESSMYSEFGGMDVDRYLKLFYSFTCDEKDIQFHFEVMKIMTSSNQEHHYDNLKLLLQLLDGPNDNRGRGTSFEEKAKVTAFILEIVRRLGEGDDAVLVAGDFYETSLLKEQYDEEFKQHNYYGFKELENFWEEAKETGNGIQHVED